MISIERYYFNNLFHGNQTFYLSHNVWLFMECFLFQLTWRIVRGQDTKVRSIMTNILIPTFKLPQSSLQSSFFLFFQIFQSNITWFQSNIISSKNNSTYNCLLVFFVRRGWPFLVFHFKTTNLPAWISGWSLRRVNTW